MAFFIISGVLVGLAIVLHFMMGPSQRREQVSSWICGLLTVVCAIAGIANLSNWRICVAWLITAVISAIYLFYCMGEANKYAELEEYDYEEEYDAEDDPEGEYFSKLDEYSEECEKKKTKRPSF